MCCGGNMVAKVVHGAVGVAKAATQVVTGIPVDQAPDDVITRRRDTCRDCEHATRNKKLLDRPSKGLVALSQCTKCDCLIKFKTRIASEKCPLDKWPAVTPIGADSAANNGA